MGKKPKSRTEIVERCDAAHREAFGKPLPAGWRRNIRTEYDDGDSAALGRYDAKVLLGAEEYRVLNGWACLGHGTVMHYLAHIDRNADHDAARKRKADKRTAASAAKQTREAGERAKDEKLQGIRLEHFRGLSDAERSGYVEQATRKFRFMKRTDLIEGQAALLAWQVYERTSVAVEI